MYRYAPTLQAFLERYENTSENTKKGMIGELLSHIIINEFFDNFEIASPFFNLEEKSIKKDLTYFFTQIIKCLRKGIVYHHGSMTDNVRLYIETVFKNSKKIKFLITTSTLLEGVNLPVERLFVLENKKGQSLLSHSQFNNLVGGINRFGDIFSDKK
ncbi:hypothetical protein GKR48_00830 [Providencia sp. wls1943]|uniref:helicase-related protein n=1 Tax=Providencia sp. wls1943 TaxID=2675150 RepID=UPI0012B5E462|nr:helicase-related protein [Providencia sp. wls1943]MTB65395.1 hypothetical protein [Providencia sp. wls1943]